MLSNFEISKYMQDHKMYKGFEIAQTDCKAVPEGSHLLYKKGFDQMHFIKIIENKTNKESNEKIEAIEVVETYKFSMYDTVQFDQYAMSQKYSFTAETGESLTLKTWLSTASLRSIMPSRIKIKIVDRKWYNKIIGFRSNQPSKMIAATLVYITFFVALFKFLMER